MEDMERGLALQMGLSSTRMIYLKLSKVVVFLLFLYWMFSENSSPIKLSQLGAKALSYGKLSGCNSGASGIFIDPGLEFEGNLSPLLLYFKVRVQNLKDSDSSPRANRPVPYGFYGNWGASATFYMSAKPSFKKVDDRSECIGNSYLDPMRPIPVISGIIEGEHDMALSIEKPGYIRNLTCRQGEPDRSSSSCGNSITTEPTCNRRVAGIKATGNAPGRYPLRIHPPDCSPVICGKTHEMLLEGDQNVLTPEASQDCLKRGFVFSGDKCTGFSRLVHLNCAGPLTPSKPLVGLREPRRDSGSFKGPGYSVGGSVGLPPNQGGRLTTTVKLDYPSELWLGNAFTGTTASGYDRVSHAALLFQGWYWSEAETRSTGYRPRLV